MNDAKKEFSDICKAALPEGEYCDADDGHYLLHIKPADDRTLGQCLASLSEAGFSVTYEHSATAARYFHAESADAYVYICLDTAAGDMRVIAAKGASPTCTVSAGEPICDPVMRQLDCSHLSTGNASGMGYIIRLADGRLIVIDGGFEYEDSADALYEAIREEARGEGKPRIAALILSHGHHDHTGAFCTFCPRYADMVEIERIFYNQCLTEEACKNISAGYAIKTQKYIKTYFPNAEHIKPFSGQVYGIGGVRLEFFWTMSDYLPRVIPNERDANEEKPKRGDLNIQSSVFRISTKDTSVFFMADMTRLAADTVSRRYGIALKSDIVQVAHHGVDDPVAPRSQNATREIYDLIAPQTAIFTTTEKKLEARALFEHNAYIISKVSEVYAYDSEKRYFKL